MNAYYTPTATSIYFREGKKLVLQNRKAGYLRENEKACAENGIAWFACEMHEDTCSMPSDSFPNRYLPDGETVGPFPTRDEAIAVSMAWCDKMNGKMSEQ